MLNYNVDKDPNQQCSSFRNKVNFEKHYEIVKHLGDGKFGKVYHVRDRENNREYAAKFIKIKKDDDKMDVEREVSILKNLAHSKIVELHDAFSTLSNNVVLIMEIVKGGELFERIADENYVVSEPDAMRIIKQLCEALNYIHQRNIIHLDIKPENIMLLSQNRNEIKLIDFGLARFYDGKEDIKFMAGTPEFAAPEVIKFENLDFHTDMWSVGVITYILLSGYSPFLGDNNAETYCNVEKGEWAFTEEFEIVSNEAKDFISKLIVYNKGSRMLPQECLSHPWLAREIIKTTQKKEKVFNTVLPIVTKEKVKDYSEKKPEMNNSIKPLEPIAVKSNAKKMVRAPTVELSAFFSFSKKNIKRGIIRRIKCENVEVVSTTVTLTATPSVTKCKTKAGSYTKRKLIAPKRATKRSDDNVLTVQEMKPLQASVVLRKTPKLVSKLATVAEEKEKPTPALAVVDSNTKTKAACTIQKNKTSIKRKEHPSKATLQTSHHGETIPQIIVPIKAKEFEQKNLERKDGPVQTPIKKEKKTEAIPSSLIPKKPENTLAVKIKSAELNTTEVDRKTTEVKLKKKKSVEAEKNTEAKRPSVKKKIFKEEDVQLKTVNFKHNINEECNIY
ncbi:unnamed protein product [Auanema sp. JU1783]|nr:unnamed protein product [Auanema sp. JU1783]